MVSKPIKVRVCDNLRFLSGATPIEYFAVNTECGIVRSKMFRKASNSCKSSLLLSVANIVCII